jgi:phosphate transport system substrate-binding protein
VRDIVEVPVGLDLLVVAQSKEAPPLRLTVKELFRALGRQFPDEYGEMNFNPHRKWSEVGKSLPNTPIEVRVMGRFSGTHEALQELLLQKGARSISEVAKHWARAPVLPKSAWEMRQDTPVVVIHESEEAIARQLVRFPSAVGILDYPVFEAHKSKLRAVEIDGAEPTPADAYDGKYPGIRTLYLYLRKDAISTVRGVSKLAAEYVSSAALGADGYLLKLGFVPLQMEVMIKTIGLARTMPTITRDALPDF